MPKMSDGRIALVALIALAAWLLIGLPLLYLPSASYENVHGEILGVKYGEWLLFAATMGLWWATWRLVKGADGTSERQLRAYVSVEAGAMFRQSKRKRLRFEFRPNIVNNGTTPAKDVRVVSFIRNVPTAIPDNFDYRLSHTIGSVSTIGPRQSRFHSIVANRNLTIAELREIQNGTNVFHAYGTVIYTDIFGIGRTTNFSFIIFPGKSSQFAVWHYTAQNNDAD
jgi:hypothetical protein